MGKVHSERTKANKARKQEKRLANFLSNEERRERTDVVINGEKVRRVYREGKVIYHDEIVAKRREQQIRIDKKRATRERKRAATVRRNKGTK